MKYIWILVLLIPSVSAQINEFTTTSDVRTVSGDFDLPILHSLEFEFNPFSDTDHRFIIHYNLEILVEMDTTGTRTFAIFFDGVQIPTCTFMYHSVGGIIEGEGVLFITLRAGCESEWEEGNAGPHNHTVSIRQIASSGTPADVSMWNSNIILDAQETETVSTFETSTGLSALEFIFMIGAFVALWFVRFRTEDLYMEILMAVLTWFLGFVWLVLYNTTLIPILLLFGILTFFTGFYWLVRSIWERVIKNSLKGIKQ